MKEALVIWWKDDCELYYSRKQLTVIYEIHNYCFVVWSGSIFSKVAVSLHKSLLPVYGEQKKVLVSPEKPFRPSFQRALWFGKSISCISILYVHVCQRHLVKNFQYLLTATVLSTCMKHTSWILFTLQTYIPVHPNWFLTVQESFLPKARIAFPVGLCRN